MAKKLGLEILRFFITKSGKLHKIKDTEMGVKSLHHWQLKTPIDTNTILSTVLISVMIKFQDDKDIFPFETALIKNGHCEILFKSSSLNEAVRRHRVMADKLRGEAK